MTSKEINRGFFGQGSFSLRKEHYYDARVPGRPASVYFMLMM